MLMVVELWWFNLVGPRLWAICNIATPGNERIFFKFVPIVEQSVVFQNLCLLTYTGVTLNIPGAGIRGRGREAGAAEESHQPGEQGACTGVGQDKSSGSRHNNRDEQKQQQKKRRRVQEEDRQRRRI